MDAGDGRHRRLPDPAARRSLAALVVALRIADVSIAAIAIGASFSAVVFGLAAQQTLGNLIAGIVLLSARPFRVGDTVRLQGGGARRADRGRRHRARPALHDLRRRRRPGARAQQRGARGRRSARCASRRRSACGRGCATARTPIELQQLIEEALTRADAPPSARRRSRRSTAPRSSCTITATPRSRRRRRHGSPARCSRRSRRDRRGRRPQRRPRSAQVRQPRRSARTAGPSASSSIRSVERAAAPAGRGAASIGAGAVHVADQQRREREEELVDQPLGGERAVERRAALAERPLRTP